jgi:hypothetical protein
LLDNNSYYPSGGLTYWLNVSNGVELSYRGVLIEYSSGDEEIVRDSISGDTAGIKYLHRFGAHTTSSVGYIYNSRFTGSEKDYDIHDGTIGFTHSFSDNSSITVSGGYFLLKNVLSDDDNGYSYDILLTQNFDRGNFSIGGNGGWREGYLEAERRGLIKYWGAESRFNYQVMERLTNYGGLSYRNDKDTVDRMTRDFRANYGWRVSFMRWFSISLDYSFLKRDDDIDANDYKANRIMMNLTAGRVFK